MFEYCNSASKQLSLSFFFQFYYTTRCIGNILQTVLVYTTKWGSALYCRNGIRANAAMEFNSFWPNDAQQWVYALRYPLSLTVFGAHTWDIRKTGIWRWIIFQLHYCLWPVLTGYVIRHMCVHSNWYNLTTRRSDWWRHKSRSDIVHSNQSIKCSFINRHDITQANNCGEHA